MTIVLPAEDRFSARASSRSLPDEIPGGIGVRDFGASLVQPIAAVREAAEICLVDCSLHDATKALDAFAGELTAADGDIDSWPGRFTAAARRIRDEFASRIPDGPSRDRFDAGFDLFAKAKAVETRSLATHKRVATNRAELDRALAGYGDTISRAMNPVSADFALNQGEAAIRNQVAAKVLSQEEGDALSRRYRTDIALRRARQFTEDDPAEAARELAKGKGGLFSDLAADQRRHLAEQAGRIAAARDADAARDAEDTGRRRDARAVLRRDAFLRDLDDRFEDGTATLADIARAVQDGILDPADAALRMEKLDGMLGERRLAADRVAKVLPQPGAFLDPADETDSRAADIYWADVIRPALPELPPEEQVRIEDAFVFSSGIAPRQVVNRLRAELLLPDPARRVAAARRAQKWLLRIPPIPVVLPGPERALIDAIDPYLELPIPDARMIELAENAIRQRETGDATEIGDSSGDGSGEDAGPGPVDDAGRQWEIEEKLSDPAAREKLRESPLDALREDAAQSDMAPDEYLARQ